MKRRATLNALVTADGICDLGDHVKVGDVYMVDDATMREMVWGRIDSPIQTKRLSIWADTTKTGSAGWMPVELLDIEGLIAGVDD